MEFVYLLLVFIFLSLLSVNLTFQLLDIYYTEKQFRFLQLEVNNIYKNESLTYLLSNIYTKKYQWIRAIQLLQKAQEYKLRFDINNMYSLSNLNNVTGYIYEQLGRKHESNYYFERAMNFSNSNINAIYNLSKMN